MTKSWNPNRYTNMPHPHEPDMRVLGVVVPVAEVSFPYLPKQALAHALGVQPSPTRIDEIHLFGSRTLKRVGDTQLWNYTSGTAKPVPLTMRESMFVNAGLHAAAQRQDSEQSRLMLADDTSPKIPARQDSDTPAISEQCVSSSGPIGCYRVRCHLGKVCAAIAKGTEP